MPFVPGGKNIHSGMSKTIFKKWQGLQMNTYEEAQIVIEAGEINISSKIAIHDLDKTITYFLKLSDDWTFIEFRIIGTGVKEQVIRQETEEVKFVDFEISPLTNALPVNYLRYHQHQHLDEKILLIQYPSLQSEYHRQRYFLSDSVVEYQNVTSNFQLRIMLDEDGF
jgi:hypothetical protein